MGIPRTVGKYNGRSPYYQSPNSVYVPVEALFPEDEALEDEDCFEESDEDYFDAVEVSLQKGKTTPPVVVVIGDFVSDDLGGIYYARRYLSLHPDGHTEAYDHQANWKRQKNGRFRYVDKATRLPEDAIPSDFWAKLAEAIPPAKNRVKEVLAKNTQKYRFW
jgi:hypothetical protein